MSKFFWKFPLQSPASKCTENSSLKFTLDHTQSKTSLVHAGIQVYPFHSVCSLNIYCGVVVRFADEWSKAFRYSISVVSVADCNHLSGIEWFSHEYNTSCWWYSPRKAYMISLCLKLCLHGSIGACVLKWSWAGSVFAGEARHVSLLYFQASVIPK